MDENTSTAAVLTDTLRRRFPRLYPLALAMDCGTRIKVTFADGVPVRAITMDFARRKSDVEAVCARILRGAYPKGWATA